MKTITHYLFDWLPKYWYDENDVPTAYEYKVEETLNAWHAENDLKEETYTIIADHPNDCDFTNVFNKTDKPIIPVKEYINTLIVKTNTDEKVRVVLKPLELFIGPDYSEFYGKETGYDVQLLADKGGTAMEGLPSMRYEVIMDSPEYTLDGMELTLSENMVLEQIDGKWYLTIKNVPADAFGTLEIELTKKEQYYQYGQRYMNYFAAKPLFVTEKLPKYFSIRMSDAVISADAAIIITFMGSDTEDMVCEKGKEALLPDYLGLVPAGYEFTGWSDTEGGKALYVAGDTIVMENDLALYPVFEKIEGAEEPEITEEGIEGLEEESETPVVQ